MKTEATVKQKASMAIILLCACLGIAALVGCSSGQASSSGAANATAEDNSDAAVEFVEGWYGDWSFEDGEMELASSNAASRCKPLVKSGTDLAQQIEDLAVQREAARCILQADVKSANDKTVEVDVEYVTTQDAGIDEEAFEEMEERSLTDELTFTFDSDGFIVSIDGLQ